MKFLIALLPLLYGQIHFAQTRNANGKFGMTEDSQIVIPYEFDTIFEEGNFYYCAEKLSTKNNTTTFLNVSVYSQSHELVSKYESMFDFNIHQVSAVQKDKKWSFINLFNERIGSLEFDHVENPANSFYYIGYSKAKGMKNPHIVSGSDCNLLGSDYLLDYKELFYGEILILKNQNSKWDYISFEKDTASFIFSGFNYSIQNSILAESIIIGFLQNNQTVLLDYYGKVYFDQDALTGIRPLENGENSESDLMVLYKNSKACLISVYSMPEMDTLLFDYSDFSINPKEFEYTYWIKIYQGQKMGYGIWENNRVIEVIPPVYDSLTINMELFDNKGAVTYFGSNGQVGLIYVNPDGIDTLAEALYDEIYLENDLLTTKSGKLFGCYYEAMDTHICVPPVLLKQPDFNTPAHGNLLPILEQGKKKWILFLEHEFKTGFYFVDSYSYQGQKKEILLFNSNGKFGILNYASEGFLKPEFDEIRIASLDEDLYYVKKNGLWGLMSGWNEFMQECIYESIESIPNSAE